jgi:hypothetical protein
MRRIALRSLVLIIAAIAGCNNGIVLGPPPGDSSVELALVGIDSPQLFDAATITADNASASTTVVSAIVTINEIDAKVDVKGHPGQHTWVPLVKSALTVDLLKLDNKTLTSLGITSLPSGHIDELRLVLDEIGDYVVLKDGTKKPLEVPDNGIVSVTGKLDLDACAAGIIILDFDPHIKVEREGSRREYELTCSSHIKTEEIKGGCAAPGPDMGHGPDMTPPEQCNASKPCGAGDICQAGICVPDPCNGVLCPGGQICQGGACVPDPCNGVFCPTGQMCVAGHCQ